MLRAPRRDTAAPVLAPAALVRLRAALEAGAAPGAALLLAVQDGPLAAVLGAVRLGTPLADIAATIATGDGAADLLVRALAIAEKTGTGAGVAVAQALDAVRDEAALDRLLRARTAQARGTTKVLLAVPLAAWLLLVGLDGSALRFYTTPVGLGTGLGATALAAAGLCWSRRLVDGARRAVAAVDPLSPPPPPPDRARIASFALPALLIVGLGVGPFAGLTAAVAAGAAAVASQARRRPGVVGSAADGAGAGGAAETVELVAIALAAGLPTGAALTVTASLAPPAARPLLAAAARRVRGGWDAENAFAGTGLATVGAVLAASDRWGSPAGGALRHLAQELRADRRAAAEEAAERVQLALVFPTTLLTLPAFVLGVVPPLLWTAFSG